MRDDGYHLIDAEMVSLDLADTLTIDPSGSGITVGGPYAAGVPTRRLEPRRPVPSPSPAGQPRCTSTSGSPTAAGSVAARPTPRRFFAGPGSPTSASPPSLGADVPFCLVGGRARVRGIGELVEPLAAEPLEVTLVVPPLHVSTPAVYRAWDALGGPTAEGPNDLEAGGDRRRAPARSVAGSDR